MLFCGFNVRKEHSMIVRRLGVRGMVGSNLRVKKLRTP